MSFSADSSANVIRPELTDVPVHIPNVCVTYMYRDAGNYKNFGELVFANPRHLTVDQIWVEARDALRGVIDFFGEPMFRPERMSLPTVFLYSLPSYSRNDDDHDWHELCSVEETNDPVTQSDLQTIEEFLGVLRKAHKSLG